MICRKKFGFDFGLWLGSIGNAPKFSSPILMDGFSIKWGIRPWGLGKKNWPLTWSFSSFPRALNSKKLRSQSMWIACYFSGSGHQRRPLLDCLFFGFSPLINKLSVTGPFLNIQWTHCIELEVLSTEFCYRGNMNTTLLQIAESIQMLRQYKWYWDTKHFVASIVITLEQANGFIGCIGNSGIKADCS